MHAIPLIPSPIPPNYTLSGFMDQHSIQLPKSELHSNLLTFAQTLTSESIIAACALSLTINRPICQPTNALEAGSTKLLILMHGPRTRPHSLPRVRHASKTNRGRHLASKKRSRTLTRIKQGPTNIGINLPILPPFSPSKTSRPHACLHPLHRPSPSPSRYCTAPAHADVLRCFPIPYPGRFRPWPIIYAKSWPTRRPVPHSLL